MFYLHLKMLIVKQNTIDIFHLYLFYFFCTFERNNNKLHVMKNSSISYIIALFLCSLACHATVVLPNKTTQPLLSVSQQQTYKVSGTVIDAKTHTINYPRGDYLAKESHHRSGKHLLL